MQTPPQPATTASLTATKTQFASLLTILEEVPDPRVTAIVDHALTDILTIALCTILCGGESFYDMEEFGEVRLDWLKTFLSLRHGAPTHDTYNRVFQALDPEKFGDCLSRWTQSVRSVLGGQVVALDGKTLRRALKKGEDSRVIVNVWATESGLLLGQRKVRDKSNEITVVPELLRALQLAGCIVTADALHCQRNIAREIVEADADYVLALKGNQGTAHAEVKAFLDDAIARKEAHLVALETLDKEHGRLEERRYWQSGKLQWFADRNEWEGLKSVGVVEARRTAQGKETVQRRYYLSSLKADVEKFARAVRGHWGVENGLHWVLDVVFGEDQSRARTGHAAENLAATRRLAVSLLRRDNTCRRSIKGKLLRAAIDPDYLKLILKT
jgi:predicted transposase YbfD/YdcC